jgi:hypothetical protein
MCLRLNKTGVAPLCVGLGMQGVDLDLKERMPMGYGGLYGL